jgi:hypothetical protein
LEKLLAALLSINQFRQSKMRAGAVVNSLYIACFYGFLTIVFNGLTSRTTEMHRPFSALILANRTSPKA